MLAVLDHSVQRESLARLFTILSAESIDADHPAHAHFVDRYRQARTGFTEWIAGAQAAGEIVDTIAPEQLAAVMIAVLDGLQMQGSTSTTKPLGMETVAALLRTLRPA